MPALQKSIELLGKPLMPKLLSPKSHAMVDYATVATFLLGGVLFWTKNRRAALASILCAATEAGVAALTDYPGGVKKAISFPLHRKLDFGFSSMVATMPEFLAFEEEREKGFFRMQSIAIAGFAALTDFRPQQIRGERERKTA